MQAVFDSEVVQYSERAPTKLPVSTISWLNTFTKYSTQYWCQNWGTLVWVTNWLFPATGLPKSASQSLFLHFTFDKSCFCFLCFYKTICSGAHRLAGGAGQRHGPAVHRQQHGGAQHQGNQRPAVGNIRAVNGTSRNFTMLPGPVPLTPLKIM